jgi:Polyketide cyclase / dehydrase and lipid transport
MIRKIVLGVAGLVAILIVVIAVQPATFAGERATVIAAPADVVFAHLDGARALDVWSPWLKMDPDLTLTHQGPETGVGSGESWEGPQMGVGRLTVTNVKPNEEVELLLEFMKPMQATNRAQFTLAPDGEGTRVAWRMEGKNDFLGKAASLVMDMDKRVGTTFESGLADLKTLAEADAKLAEPSGDASGVDEGAPMSVEEMKAALEAPPSDSDEGAPPATPPSDE